MINTAVLPCCLQWLPWTPATSMSDIHGALPSKQTMHGKASKTTGSVCPYMCRMFPNPMVKKGPYILRPSYLDMSNFCVEIGQPAPQPSKGWSRAPPQFSRLFQLLPHEKSGSKWTCPNWRSKRFQKKQVQLATQKNASR